MFIELKNKIFFQATQDELTTLIKRERELANNIDELEKKQLKRVSSPKRRFGEMVGDAVTVEESTR